MYDETPPRVVRSTPINQAINSSEKKITIYFDEYIKIENASEKVVISPPQIEMPEIEAVGKKIRVKLFDTLRANTTYTIDFADAIVDNNEGNPMGNYAFSFSTGNHIDTLECSGYVLNAEDLEPIKGILVGLYETDPDSIIPDSILTQRAFDRVSRTNGSGHFVIKGLKADRRYRAFALKDMDNDYRFSQKSEQLALDTLHFIANCGPDIRLDTIWRDSTHYDSINPVRFIHYYPDNLVLRAYTEAGQDRHLLKTERLTPERFTIYFTAPSDSFPTIQGLNFGSDSSFVIDYSEGLDTISYWIADTTIAYSDTLYFAYTYLDSDTAHQLQWKTDTFELTPKTTRKQQLKELQKEIESWTKDYKKRLKKNPQMAPETCPSLTTYLEVKCSPSSNVDPDQIPILTFSEPIQPLDTAHIRFTYKQDSLDIPQPYELIPIENRPCQVQLYTAWDYGKNYTLVIDSASIQGALGHTNKPVKIDFRVQKEDEYNSIFIQPTLKDTNIIVELLNSNGNVIKRANVDATGTASFYYLRPADYYVRCFIDANGDGEWTTGDFATSTPPEERYYFPKQITLKAGWELTQTWDVRGIPLNTQKPTRLVKQKPDKEKRIKNRNKEREEQWGKR